MKTLFFYPNESSFINVDQSIFRRFLHIRSYCLNQPKGKGHYLLALIGIIPRVLLSFRSRLTICWFADYHAFLMVLAAKICAKKSVVMVGGFDAVHYPEFAYGVFHKPLRRFCATWALKNCDLIIANHSALLSSNNTYYNPDGHPEGLFKLIPNLHTKAIVVENCITTKAPAYVPPIRTRQILCVGTTPRFEDFYNKGYDLMLDAALEFPDWQFVFIGLDPRWLDAVKDKYHTPLMPNLTIHHSLPHSRVLQIMSETDIYVQASISEGMPNALMEAMLYGCKPIGSNVAGIPTIIDNQGIILNRRDPQKLIEALKRCMETDADRQAISQSISTRFSLEKRTSKLHNAICELT
ncbi:MAG: glycosyltransferase family 4 protein [Candidatus Cloacimonadaceae bacterium]|jgi:glycosyltransferase involved in cell wall biosynthesis|nr:glycosyltransferase family 4 protein [Candidatus Cloacimonadaceae bacterium]